MKYRKHKKNNKAGNGVVVSAAAAALGVKAVMESNNGKTTNSGGVTTNGNHRKSPMVVTDQQQQQQQPHGVVPRIANGNILKTALTNPSEVLHLRRRLESAVTSSRDAISLPYESALPTICTLIYCDEFEDIATLKVHVLAHLDRLFKFSLSIWFRFDSWTSCWTQKPSCRTNSAKSATLLFTSWYSGPNGFRSILNFPSR